MMNSKLHISIVSPFYNEEANVEAFYSELKTVLDELPYKHDMVFVDDGSTDNTLQIMQELASKDPAITVLALSRNFGHQMALTAGLDFATGDVVVVMDSDLQHPPELIPSLIEKYLAGTDVVYAVREKPSGLPSIKYLTSQLFYWFLEKMTNLQFTPGSADFRLMRSEVVKTLQEMRETHRYLRGLVPWIGWTTATIHYHQPERRSGKPSYNLRKSIQLARYGMFSFSTVPLELITWLGLGLASLGGIYLAYILVISLCGIAVQGWTSTISVVLVLGGVQLLSFGVVAQYVGMIFEQVKNRPLYVLKYKKISSELNQERLTDDR